MQNKVTDIQIIPIRPKDGLVAFTSFVFDESFYCSSIGIYTRPEGGYRLTYPNRKLPSGNLPVFHPINKEIADAIEQCISNKFEELIMGDL
jgi:stage V sporulation protein G